MKLLLATQYFVYFGTLGIALPYFNLFCRHLGFSGFEIGLISSVKTAAVVIFPVLWAMAADRFNSRKSIFILCTLMSAFLWSLLFFTREFLPILIILTVYSVFYSPIIAFIEAFAMNILGKEKKKYGHSRVWGTIAFIGVSLVLGKILLVYPTDIIIPLILAGMVMQSLLSLKMPDSKKKEIDKKGVEASEEIKDGAWIEKKVCEKSQIWNNAHALMGTTKNESRMIAHIPKDFHIKVSETERKPEDGAGRSWSEFRDFFSLRTSLFLFAAFLMLASHGAYYGFFSIYLESLGFGTGFIGFAWALASIAEIAVMVNSDRIFSRFNLKTVMMISFGAAFVRWLLLFSTSLSHDLLLFNHATSIVILVSQLLHAFTYGSFHIASILAIDRLSPEGTTFGQAVNNAVTYGAGMMTGFMISGIFYDNFHAYLFLASGGVALAGGITILYVKFDSH
ncbi:MAG: MFS transporter [Desulfamplus sp.]|nr:MFS transporter [Desulfamplus sp.]